jgi:hypothetical protein
MSYSAAGDAPIRPGYARAYSVFVLMTGHLVDLVPRIYACPYQAIPPGSTPSQPQEHRRPQDTIPGRTDLLPM